MIQVEHVSRRFGTFKAVDDISFSIETGEIIGLLGPNGAGKTTTMRMITGFLEPSEGTILVDGMDVTKNPVETKKKIGYMMEGAPLYSDMIVADYLEYVAKMEGQDPSEKVPYLAEICGLKEVMHKNISELSRGNKQRVGLAHALMGDPEILILDEPTSGLDPNQVAQVRELIKTIGETRTVIVSTHILSEVETLCSRVIIISGGKKVADSSTKELMQNSASGSTISVTVSDIAEEKIIFAIQSAAKNIKCRTTSSSDGRTTILISVKPEDISKTNDIRPKIARALMEAGANVYEIVLHEDSLEDVFKSLTQGGKENE